MPFTLFTPTSRVQSMHQRIENEMNSMNNMSFIDDSTEVVEGEKIIKDSHRSDIVGKKKKLRSYNKPKTDILQKSEKKKQLEEFERVRIAKMKEKKRKDQIEREAKREASLLYRYDISIVLTVTL